MNYATPETKPGTKIRFNVDGSTYPVGPELWPVAVVIGPDPSNSASILIRDEWGHEWSTHWAYTRLISELVAPSIPQPLPEPDLKALKKVVRDYLEFRASDNFHEDSDFVDVVFETAIEALYGKTIWVWLKTLKA